MGAVFDITTQEVASFDGAFYRFTTIDGPQRLVRFSDTGRGEAGRSGRFWLYGSELIEILGQARSEKGLLKEAHQRWAVSDDWGDMGLVWLMNIKPGQSVRAAWGRAKFQPKISAAGQEAGKRQTRRSYAGESLQLIIPVRDTDGREDPFLVSMIRGPVTTEKLMTAPSRFLA